jgi:hypothetical protein
VISHSSNGTAGEALPAEGAKAGRLRATERHAGLHEVEVGHGQRRQFRAASRRSIRDTGKRASAPADRPVPQNRQKGTALKAEQAEARAINAQPWEPPPGMVKRQCPECRYFFAAPSINPEAVLLCPDCAAAGTKRTAPMLTEPP